MVLNGGDSKFCAPGPLFRFHQVVHTAQWGAACDIPCNLPGSFAEVPHVFPSHRRSMARPLDELGVLLPGLPWWWRQQKSPPHWPKCRYFGKGGRDYK